MFGNSKDQENNNGLASEEKKEENRGFFSKFSIKIFDSGTPPFLVEIKQKLEEKIIGQDLAIKRLMRNIAAYYAKLNDPKRPIAIYLFAGPSGSGKTYTAEELAYILIGKPEAGLSPLVKIDCGGLSLHHTISSLTGSPPGYVGYGDEVGIENVGRYERGRVGLEELEEAIQEWTEKVKLALTAGDIKPSHLKKYNKFVKKLAEEIERKCGPFRSVVLFDEIEKADMNIQSQLLRILDEGILQLHNGKVVNFRGSIIILTTNVGTRQILDEYISKKKIGFKTPAEEDAKKADSKLNEIIWRRVKEEIKKSGYFKPELLGRIGEKGIIVFHSLKPEDYQKILELQLKEVQAHLSEDFEGGPGALSISYSKRFKEFLVEEGINAEYGARALRDVIRIYVRSEIANKILNKDLKVGDKILMDIKTTKILNEEGKEERITKVIIKIQPRPDGQELVDFSTRIERTQDFSAQEFLREFYKPKSGENPVIKQARIAFGIFFQKLLDEKKDSPPPRQLNRGQPNN